MSEASAVIIFQSHLHHLHYIKCIASCFSNYNYNNDYYYGFCGSPWNICSWRFSDDPIFTLGLTCSCGSVKFVCDTQIQADQWWLQEASDDPESHPVLSSTLQNTAPWVLWLWYLSHMYAACLHDNSLIKSVDIFVVMIFPGCHENITRMRILQLAGVRKKGKLGNSEWIILHYYCFRN